MKSAKGFNNTTTLIGTIQQIFMKDTPANILALLKPKSREDLIEFLNYKAEQYEYYIETLMCTMCHYNKPDIVKFLLENTNVNVNHMDSYALRYSIDKGRDDVCRILIKHGAICDDDSLVYACVNSSFDIVMSLIENGANPRCSHDLPMRIACKWGKAGIVKELIENYGADVHARDDNAIFEAARAGEHGVVKLLLSKGATITKEAAHAAYQGNYYTIMDLFAKHPSFKMDYNIFKDADNRRKPHSKCIMNNNIWPDKFQYMLNDSSTDQNRII